MSGPFPTRVREALDKLQEQLKELLARPKGLFLFAAPPDAGLRTMTNLVLRDGAAPLSTPRWYAKTAWFSKRTHKP